MDTNQPGPDGAPPPNPGQRPEHAEANRGASPEGAERHGPGQCPEHEWTNRAPSPERAAPGRRRWSLYLPYLVLPTFAALLLWRALAGGEALLPARLLLLVLPWREGAPADAAIPWNPLLWDGIAQFYPWRRFAAQSMVAGQIPLWDPYQLCGTPFLANSQSAPLYPLHWLYYLPGSVAPKIGWLAFLHLALAGLFTTAWVERLGARRWPAVLAGVLFMGSGFVVTWLELPSFLTVACWIPLLLLAVGQALDRRSWPWALTAGAALGMMLLGGHLQIALYGLLAAGLLVAGDLVAGLGNRRRRRPRRRTGLRMPLDDDDEADDDEADDDDCRRRAPLPFLPLAGLVALVLGFGLAAAQVLPSLELSRLSHRAAGEATTGGYRLFLRTAMQPSELVTLFAPDFFGHPLNGDYHGWTNYTETAGYLGIVGLALALMGLGLGWRVHYRAVVLALGALLALWMAVGGAIDAFFYFHVPGFSQSGSPGRVLVLFCLFGSALAGLGAEMVRRALAVRPGPERQPVARAAVVIALLMAAAFARALWTAGPESQSNMEAVAKRTVGSFPPFTMVLERQAAAVDRAWLLLLVGVGLPALLLFLDASGRRRVPQLRWCVAVPALGALAVDLFLFAGQFNPTAPLQFVYPRGRLTGWLQAHTAGERILSINNDWDLYRPPEALLPPNATLVYRLLDAQGYDSLMVGRYKELFKAALGEDPSPLQNGNMVLAKRVTPALLAATAVRWVVAAQPLDPARFTLRFSDGTMGVYEVRQPVPIARFAPPGESSPAGWRVTGPGRREVAVATGSGGVLRIVENWAPGWRWRWAPEGSAAPGASGAVGRDGISFQAVAVPAGTGRLLLRYEPASFRIGLFLSLAALGVLAGAGGRYVLSGAGRGQPRR